MASLAAAGRIVDAIAADDQDEQWRVPLDGDAAQAILFAHAERVGLSPANLERSARSLRRCVANAGAVAREAGLWNGLAGVGWTLAYLADGEIADEGYGLIVARLTTWARSGEVRYDLIGGLVGLGLLALERPDHDAARQLAVVVVNQLAIRAAPRAGGVLWPTRVTQLPDWQRLASPSGHDDLGLAHGSAGVVALLARLVTRGIERERTEPLLRSAVGGLLAAAPIHDRTDGCYPDWLAIDQPPGQARLAWCYGDLGVAVAIFSAARAIGEASWSAAALDLARAAAARSVLSARVGDAGLCHGAAGVAHLFNRLAQASGDAVLTAASRSWFERLLAMHSHELPLGGFPAIGPADGEQGVEADPSLLTGAAGVALALIAAATTDAPSWDRLLLVDLD